MKKNAYLLPYEMKSEGCKELALAMGLRRLHPTNPKAEPSPKFTIINWGLSEYLEAFNICKFFNHPADVKRAVNKLSFFQVMKNTRTVPWTADLKVVSEWLEEGSTVCGRELLRGSGGRGLILFDNCDHIPRVELYTRYIKKKDEFRVHVVAGEVIRIQRKALKKDFEPDDNIDHRIRNIANGYIFARNDIHCPSDVETQSLLSVKEAGLDFGAVDVLWNEKKQQAYVLEINTAPGLEGSTVQDYANAFRKLLTIE